MNPKFFLPFAFLAACAPLEINRAAVIQRLTPDVAEQIYLACIPVEFVPGTIGCPDFDPDYLGCYNGRTRSIQISTIDFRKLEHEGSRPDFSRPDLAFRPESVIVGALAHEYCHALRHLRNLPQLHDSRGRCVMP